METLPVSERPLKILDEPGELYDGPASRDLEFLLSHSFQPALNMLHVSCIMTAVRFLHRKRKY